MYEKFEQLDKIKRDKIINAGFKEFGINGYDRGSTNKIVLEAGISKGSIFNYFGSKENYYFYLLNYTVDFLLASLNDRVDHSITDLLELIEEYMIHKITIFEEYPMVFQFMKSYMTEANPEISEKVWAKLSTLKDDNMNMYTRADYTLFREGLDPVLVINTIMCTLEKVSYSGFNGDGSNYDMDETVAEVRKYLKFFRIAFYKSEYQV